MPVRSFPTVRCLDITRLISRQGRGPLTGIDRVELAYLTHLLDDQVPLYLLARTALGYLLLDPGAARQVADRFADRSAWGKPDLIGRLSRRATPEKRRAEADLRRLAVARCRRGSLVATLRRVLPGDCSYINVGHSNLGNEVLDAWRGLSGARIAVLVHDTIPLDYPHFQRPDTVEAFEAKLRRVAAAADLVICNSQQTEADVTRWFSQWGDVPGTLVAHLGVDLPQEDAAQLPRQPDLTRPTFVSLGTIEPRKNHALLLDVWESLAQELPEAQVPQLVIAGARGWQNRDLFARLDSSPLMGRHVFEMSGLPDSAVAALIRRSAGVLFPSLAEGYGLPAAEAVALGTPVICSDLRVFREFLGNIPVYAESADVYSWKQSILRLAEKKKVGQTDGGQKSKDFDIPTWADHFNLVLKVA